MTILWTRDADGLPARNLRVRGGAGPRWLGARNMAVESRLDSRYRFRLDRNRAPLSELGSPSTGAGPRPPISGHRSPAFGLRDPVTAIRNSELRVPTTELGLQNPN